MNDGGRALANAVIWRRYSVAIQKAEEMEGVATALGELSQYERYRQSRALE